MSMLYMPLTILRIDGSSFGVWPAGSGRRPWRAGFCAASATKEAFLLRMQSQQARSETIFFKNSVSAVSGLWGRLIANSWVVLLHLHMAFNRSCRPLSGRTWYKRASGKLGNSRRPLLTISGWRLLSDFQTGPFEAPSTQHVISTDDQYQFQTFFRCLIPELN